MQRTGEQLRSGAAELLRRGARAEILMGVKVPTSRSILRARSAEAIGLPSCGSSDEFLLHVRLRTSERGDRMTP